MYSLSWPAYSEDWQEPWNSIKHAAAQKCAEMFDNYQLQAVCMSNEKDGYDKMQNNFGLPHDEAIKAKSRCSKMFNQFQLQAVCMENEKDGYDQMQKYYQ
jgi:acetyl-CoA carboxylase alpha subunit